MRLGRWMAAYQRVPIQASVPLCHLLRRGADAWQRVDVEIELWFGSEFRVQHLEAPNENEPKIL